MGNVTYLGNPYQLYWNDEGDTRGFHIFDTETLETEFIENHKAGKLRIVASIGAKRQALLPNVPTFTELGFANLEDLPYYGIFAPVGTPQPIIDKYGAALQKVLAMPDVKQKLTTLGLTVGYEPQGQFAGRVRSYTQTWERIIQSSGFKPL